MQIWFSFKFNSNVCLYIIAIIYLIYIRKKKIKNKFVYRFRLSKAFEKYVSILKPESKGYYSSAEKNLAVLTFVLNGTNAVSTGYIQKGYFLFYKNNNFIKIFLYIFVIFF